MCSSENQIDPASRGLDIMYTQNPDGTYDFDEIEYFNEVEWDEWIDLPIRPWDLVIHTAKRIIRIPSIVICFNFAKMPVKKPKPTKEAIKNRDGNRCIYSGVLLTNSTFTLDHVIPRSRGGKDTFENLGACLKEINLKKGDRSVREAGLKLRKQLKAPMGIPVSSLIKEIRHRDHQHFLNKL
jgi:hypothetical protein